MNIVIDGFGGDHAPLEPLRGAAAAVAELGVSVTVTGDEAKLRECAQSNNIPLNNITFVHAATVIPVDEEPTKILKAYADCSLAVALALVAQGEAQAVVSAGSTGALLAGATFIVKRAKGVKRPAIGTLVPTAGGKFYLLVDAGANHDCRPEMLCQFAVMGTAYYEKIMGGASPRVGLINIGTEAHKGTDLYRQTHAMLKTADALNFVGNIEARELPNNGCDVAVCDGFTGNVILKLSEGFATFFGGVLKDVFMANVATKLGALLVSKQIRAFKRAMDYKEYGGAPILGTAKPVIKAHGSSDAKAFKNAIRQAKFCVERDVCQSIEQGVAHLKDEGKE
ncbi:MAG: phosphate acyltransferase PlsX [Candidatus Fimivivens sp.]